MIKKYSNGGTADATGSTGGAAGATGGNPFNWFSFMTGYNPTGGGTNMFGQPVPGYAPGGGAGQGLASIAGGIADLIYANKAIKRQETEQKQARDRQQAFTSALHSGLYDSRVAQATRDLAQAGLRKSDTTALQEASAGAMRALSADPRALAGSISSIQRNEAAGRMQMQQADLQRELASKGMLAQAEQAALDENIGMRRGLGMQMFNRALDAERMATQNIENLRASKAQAWGDIGAGVINVGTSAFMPGFNDGGVMKTPGEFSHKKNPIDIMKDGTKIGEMTGGEYILNPEQSDAIEDAYEMIKEKQGSKKKVSMDDLMMLYKAVRGVFSQPQFQD
jgi:hypothetical protein